MADLKTFTLEEVAKHNTREDCWVIVGTDVLDVTKYLDEHPGGFIFFLNFKPIIRFVIKRSLIKLNIKRRRCHFRMRRY